MATNLGRKYTCYSCHTKFYDLNKQPAVCPKCAADQRDAEEAPVVTSGRGRAKVVEEPVEEPEFEAESSDEAEETLEEDLVTAEPEEEEEEEDEEY